MLLLIQGATQCPCRTSSRHTRFLRGCSFPQHTQAEMLHADPLLTTTPIRRPGLLATRADGHIPQPQLPHPPPAIISPVSTPGQPFLPALPGLQTCLIQAPGRVPIPFPSPRRAHPRRVPFRSSPSFCLPRAFLFPSPPAACSPRPPPVARPTHRSRI